MNGRTIVRRIFSSSVLSVLLLTGCNITEPTQQERLNIRGEITMLKTEGLGYEQALAEILIEEDPSVPLDEWKKNLPNVSSRKVLFTVLAETVIYRQIGDESPVEIGLEELTVGSEVRAWNTGYVIETGLPRAYAERIILVSPAP